MDPVVITALDQEGRGVARIDGKATEDSKSGHLASGVPGSVAGLWAAYQKLGSKKLTWTLTTRTSKELLRTLPARAVRGSAFCHRRMRQGIT